MPFIIAYF